MQSTSSQSMEKWGVGSGQEGGNCMYVWGVCVALCLLDAYLGNSTGCRTVTMTAPLLITSGPLRYEAVLHSCETSPIAEGGDG